ATLLEFTVTLASLLSRPVVWYALRALPSVTVMAISPAAGVPPTILNLPSVVGMVLPKVTVMPLLLSVADKVVWVTVTLVAVRVLAPTLQVLVVEGRLSSFLQAVKKSPTAAVAKRIFFITFRFFVSAYGENKTM